MSRQFWICCGVAWRSRGNQASGTLTQRPSASPTVRSSSFTVTRTARGSALGAEELMPCLQYLLSMLDHQSLEPTKLTTAESTRERQRYRIEPVRAVERAHEDPRLA